LRRCRKGSFFGETSPKSQVVVERKFVAVAYEEGENGKCSIAKLGSQNGNALKIMG
jgi:hypothetical protein